MAQTIKLKRSATQNAVPSTSQLELGEVAINTYDGKMYIKKNDGSDSIVEIGGDATSSSGLDFTGNLNLEDNVRIVIGDGNDLQIYHDGSTSYINETGTGGLDIRSNEAKISSHEGETMAVFSANAGVSLRYNNSAKLATTSTGIDVTGTVLSDGLRFGTATDHTIKWGSGAEIVGIGSNDQSISIRLDPSDASNFGYLEITDGSSNKRLLFVDDSGDISFYEDTGATAKLFWDASAERLGIGTTSPTEALDVRTQAVVGNGTDGVKLTYSTTNSSGIIDTGFTSTALEFRTGNSFAALIDSSGNVGIGTNAPAKELHIASTQPDIRLQDTDGTNHYSDIMSSAGNLYLQSRKGTDDGKIIFRGLGGGSATEYARFDSNGNFSIGNTNSGAPLVVQSNSNAQGILVFGRSSDDISQLDFSENDGTSIGGIQARTTDFRIRSVSNIPLLFMTNNTERARVDTSGNLLVGTTTADAEGITLRGDSHYLKVVRNGAITAYFDRKTSDGDILKIRKDGSDVGTFGSNQNQFLIDSNAGNIVISANNGSSSIITKGTLRPLTDNTNDLGISTRRYQDLFLAGTIYGGSTLTLDPSAHGDDTGTVVIAGNLQVDGTTTTINSTTLTVDDKNITLASGSTNAAAANGAGITVDCGSDTDATFTYANTTDRWNFNKSTRVSGLTNAGISFTSTESLIDGSSSLPNGRIFYHSSHLIYDSPSSGHRFAVAGNQGTNIAMVIDSGQRVGIGTTAPTSAYKLDVRGRVRIENDVPELSLKDTDGTNQIASIRVIQGSGLVLSSQDNTSNGIIRFLGNNGTTESEYARITSTGSLAIGQEAAPQKLTVAGNITVTGTTGIQIATLSRVSDAGRFELRDSGGNTKVQINPNDISYINGGKLLINATSSTPADRFYINGDGYATGGWRTGTAATFVGEMTNASGKLAIQTAANRDIQLGDTNNPTALYIDTSEQKVGIATATPGEKLHVSGGNIKVANTDTPAKVLLDDSRATAASEISQRSDGRLSLAAVAGSYGTTGIEILSNGKTGIGQVTPDRRLHVKDTNYSVARLERDGAGGGVALEFKNGDGNIWQVSNDGDEVLRFYYGVNNRFEVTSTGAATFNNAFTFPTTDGSANQVLKTDGSGNVTWATEAAVSANTSISDADGDTKIQVEESSDEDSIRFDTAGTQRMRILSNGLVAIGNGADIPTEKLHVFDNINNSSVLTSTGTNTRGAIIKIENDNTNAGAWAGLDLRTNTGDARIAAVSTSSDDNDTDLAFIVDDKSAGAGVERLRIKGETGNIGIGTDLPGNKLSINTSANGDGLDILSNNTKVGTFGRTVNGSTVVASLDGVTGRPINIGGNVNTSVILGAAGGSVGIGIASPTKSQHLYYTSTSTSVTAEGLAGGSAGKGLLIQNAGTASNSYANLDFRANNADGRIAYQYKGTTNVGDFHFITDNTNAPQTMLFIKNDGPIGLGTTVPGSRLQVGSATADSSNYITFGKRVSSGESNLPFIGHDSKDGTTSDLGLGARSTSGQINFYTGNNAAFTASRRRMIIDANGRVIIGGSNSFTVGGNAQLSLSTAVNSVYLTAGASNSDLIYSRRQGTGHFITQAYNGGNTGTIELNPYGGNVGIGTGNTVSSTFQVEELGIDTRTTTTTATTQVAIDTMAAATFRSAEFTIQVTNSTDSTYHLTKVLLIHDGTTPGITEYGTVFTGSAAEATFDADISSGNVRLLATPASTDSMTFKVVRHCITV